MEFFSLPVTNHVDEKTCLLLITRCIAVEDPVDLLSHMYVNYAKKYAIAFPLISLAYFTNIQMFVFRSIFGICLENHIICWISVYIPKCYIEIFGIFPLLFNEKGISQQRKPVSQPYNVFVGWIHIILRNKMLTVKFLNLVWKH